MRILPFALLALAACSRQPSPPTVPPARPLSDAAIGYLETRNAVCEWRRVDGPHDDRIAALPSACGDVAIAWSADGTRLVIAQTVGGQPAARVAPANVPLADRNMWLWSSAGLVALPMPQHGTVQAFGFDLTGAPAVTTLVTTTGLGYWGKLVTMTGNDGPPCRPSVMTHQRLTGDMWEVVNAWEKGCKAIDRGDVEWFQSENPISSQLPRLRQFTGEVVTDPRLVQRLDAVRPWIPPALVTTAALAHLRPGATPRDVHQALALARKTAQMPLFPPPWHAATTEGGGTIARRDGDVVFIPTNGQPILPPDAPPAVVSLVVRGEFALLADRGGTHPRLYDLRSGSVVWKSDTAQAATFWPEPARPDGVASGR